MRLEYYITANRVLFFICFPLYGLALTFCALSLLALCVYFTPSTNLLGLKMSTKKRASDDATPSKRKKPRLSQTQSDTHQDTEITSILRPDEVDFPRGGGTSLSAVEYKAVKAEALKELRDELVFKVGFLLYACTEPA